MRCVSSSLKLTIRIKHKLWNYCELIIAPTIPQPLQLGCSATHCHGNEFSLSLSLSPDGSYTEDHGSSERHFKSQTSEFDADFDDDLLPSIGTCKSLYPFQGTYFLIPLSLADV